MAVVAEGPATGEVFGVELRLIGVRVGVEIDDE